VFRYCCCKRPGASWGRGRSAVCPPSPSAQKLPEGEQEQAGGGQNAHPSLGARGACLPVRAAAVWKALTSHIHQSCPATSVTRRCQMLIVFYCTAVSKPGYLLCLSIKDVLFFVGCSHPWVISVFVQHLQNKKSFLVFFFFFF